MIRGDENLSIFYEKSTKIVIKTSQDQTWMSETEKKGLDLNKFAWISVELWDSFLKKSSRVPILPVLDISCNRTYRLYKFWKTRTVSNDYFAQSQTSMLGDVNVSFYCDGTFRFPPSQKNFVSFRFC